MNDRFERSLVFTCSAVTDIWTGGGDQKGEVSQWCDEQHLPANGAHERPNGSQRQLHLTSILGGIRWWAEAIVRSFGGRACDPTARDGPNAVCAKDHLCLICSLFGNPNQPIGAKFALRCWNDGEGHSPKTAALKKDEVFYLEFLFYESKDTNRDPKPYEIWLLAKTLDLIASYGSIGGKTVFKPTAATVTLNDIGRRFRHTDFGLIEIKNINIPEAICDKELVLDSGLLVSAIATGPRSSPTSELPNFNNFWFVENFTLNIHPPSPSVPNTGSFNDLIGIADVTTPQKKPAVIYFKDGLDSIRAHLRGTLAEKSKRVFSFRNPARTWGFVIPNEYVRINVPASTVTEEPTCKVAVQRVLDSVNPSAGRSVLWGDTLKVKPLSFSLL